MERERHFKDGLPADDAFRPAERRARIHEGLEEAWRTGRRIDDLTAKRIAQELDPGSGPLHEFVETGAIPEGIGSDLAVADEVVREMEPQSRIPWVAVLREYVAGRAIKGELPYWNDPSME